MRLFKIGVLFFIIGLSIGWVGMSYAEAVKGQMIPGKPVKKFVKYYKTITNEQALKVHIICLGIKVKYLKTELNRLKQFIEDVSKGKIENVDSIPINELNDIITTIKQNAAVQYVQCSIIAAQKFGYLNFGDIIEI